MLAQRRRRWPSITSVLGQCIVLSGVSDARMESVTPTWQCSSQKTRYNQSMQFQCQASVEDCGSTLKQHWVNVTCLRKVISRPSDGLVLGQRRGRLPGIEPAMGCDAGQTLNRNLVDPLYEVLRRQVLNECWPAPARVVKEYTLFVYSNVNIRKNNKQPHCRISEW